MTAVGLALLALVASGAEGRPASEIKEELKEVERQYNRLRWVRFRKLAAQHLSEDEAYQKLVEKREAADAALEAWLREETVKTEEGKALYAELDRLKADLAKAEAEGGKGVWKAHKAVSEQEKKIEKYRREEKIESWSREAYRPLHTARGEALGQEFEKGVALMATYDVDELQQFVAELKAVTAKKEALEAELKAAE
jgi:hypothetical protein